MQPYSNEEARFKIKSSGELFTVIPSDIEWQRVSETSSPELDSIYRASYTFVSPADAREYALAWELSESHGREQGRHTHFPSDVELLKDFDFGLTDEPVIDTEKGR